MMCFLNAQTFMQWSVVSISTNHCGILSQCSIEFMRYITCMTLSGHNMLYMYMQTNHTSCEQEANFDVTALLAQGMISQEVEQNLYM